MTDNNKYTGFEVAIIGLSCRFPGASNWREYWNNLKEGKESIRFLSEEELLNYNKGNQVQNKKFIAVNSSLSDKDCFDSHFFDYTPEEAALMNPQSRIFHECVWEAIEDAGYNHESYKGSIGIYSSASEDVNWKIYSNLVRSKYSVPDFTLKSLNNKDFMSTLVSYKLNLKGPSIFVQTACSSSLFAIHMACKALVFGETKMAVAGGVSIVTGKQKGYIHEEGSIYSKDGHCKAFDINSSGTVDGEGAGVVVLKRLADAISDGDHIYSIIKGNAVNNDGKRKVGYTAPSIEGQVDCITMAQKVSKVEPESISYIEAHGTGTKLGDSIEIEALNIAFKRNKNISCPIGSVKTNIGHLDTTAGVAGLIKTALSLKFKQIPSSLHFNEADKEINFDGGPFYVNTKLQNWEPQDKFPRRAGVSSFGIGGTNVHMVLEEAPDIKSDSLIETRKYKLLTLSAKSENSLKRYINSLKEFVDIEKPNDADIAYTFQTGRKHFEYRKTFVYKNKEELLQTLGSENANKLINRIGKRSDHVIFMFSGAGSQYVNMGLDLYLTDNFFKEELDKGFNILKSLTGINYKDILYPLDSSNLVINEMLHTQPVIFLFEYALARLLMHYGIIPQYLIGHSIGEYVAACISGIFSYDDALKLVIKRGQLMNTLSGGLMVSSSISHSDAMKYANDKVSIAAINSPDQIVFSGDTESIRLLTSRFEQDDVSFVMLQASQAGHSHMIDDILDEYKNVLLECEMNSPKIPFVSNLTGNFVEKSECCTVEYWLKHMRETVKFSDGINKILNISGDKLFIEVGGGHSLTSFLRQHNHKINLTAINIVRHFKEEKNDEQHFLECLGQVWANGFKINWSNYYNKEKRNRISLPTYSFEKIKYPTEVDPFENELLKEVQLNNSTSNQELKDWIYYPTWKSSILQTVFSDIQKRKYLFFSLDNELDSKLTSKLLQAGSEVIEVVIGNEYKKISENKYCISPVDSSSFVELFNNLVDSLHNVSDIVYSWAASVDSKKIELIENNREFNLVYLNVIKIIQELQTRNFLRRKKISIITNCLHKVTGNEEVLYAQSLILGLVNVLPQEYSVSCFNIDINLNEKNDCLVDELLLEITDNHNKKERILALRNGQRWIKDYQKNSSPLVINESKIESGELYLITGGLGKVGCLLAKHLLSNKQAKVVLTGRKKIIKGEKSLGNDRLKELEEIAEGNVYYYNVDVSDSSSFKKTIDAIELNIGRIRGVIHAAGTTDWNEFELIEDISFKKTVEVLTPKVIGIQNIYEIFKDKTLDFVWITSSLASVLGGLSFASYTAANLFMDYFISSKNELKNWKTICLSEMLFTSEDIEKENEGNRRALKPTEIIRLFDWSISVKNSQTILETVENLFSRIYKVFEKEREIYLDDAFSVAKIEKVERPNLANQYVAPKTETEIKLILMLENFFGINMIGIDDNFLELGGDSLKAMVFLKRIKKEFNVSLPIKDFFSSSNIKEISNLIESVLWMKADVKTVNEIVI